jgi:hypothetical protein
MNGRVGNDSNIGELTCRNASAVDYFICTPSLIKCIDDLTVLDFSKCCSDVHTPLSITFESNVFLRFFRRIDMYFTKFIYKNIHLCYTRGI